MAVRKLPSLLVTQALLLTATHGFVATPCAKRRRGNTCSSYPLGVGGSAPSLFVLRSAKGDSRDSYSLGLKPYSQRKPEGTVEVLPTKIVELEGNNATSTHLPIVDLHRSDGSSEASTSDAPSNFTVNPTLKVINASQPGRLDHQALDIQTTLSNQSRASDDNPTLRANNATSSRAKEVNASSTIPPPSSKVSQGKSFETSHPWSSYIQSLSSIYQPTASSKREEPNVTASSNAIMDALSTAPTSSSGKSSLGLPATSASGAAFDLTKKKGSDPLTLHDLENILLTKRFVREADLQYHLTNRPPASSLPAGGGGGGLSGSMRKSGAASDSVTTSKSSPASSSSASSKRIAFPQPAVLNDKIFQRSCTIASGALCMLVATSIVPNLWLMGALVGGLYGQEASKRQHVDEDGAAIVDRGPLESLALYMGRRLALAYLRVYDAFNAVFFMWKTGQLSYEYYKTYAALDERFAIQRKVDAWNAFFVEGKIAFDRWERENEVSRKILAGLRTAWLVEERSLKKSRRKRQSKYRIIQLVYDAEDVGRRFSRSLWKAMTGGGSSEFRDFLKGVRIDITDSQASAWGSRLGSVLAALLAVNLTGALFAISPSFLSFLAILVGVAWPTWASEFYDRLNLFAQEARARGRGDPKPIMRKVDKSKYHYFVRDDGKKRYYRVGRPWFEPQPSNKRKKNERKPSDEGWDWSFLPWA